MNVINKALLKLALLPSGLYRRLGADIDHVATILAIKLTIDDRSPNTLHQVRRNQSSKPVTAATVGTMVFSAFLGVLYLWAFFVDIDTTTRFTLYFSMFLTLLCSMLIADFTSVLLDVRDNVVILTRPVSDATFLVARLLHIFIHLSKLVLPMALPGFVLITTRYGLLQACWFLLVTIQLILFSIFVINAVYLLAMRLVSPRKFQAWVSYVQVFLAILVYAGYQVLPRLLGDFVNVQYHIADHWYALLLPPFWFAAGWQVLEGPLGGYSIVGAILCFVLPILAIWLVVRRLAGAFIRQLALTNAAADQSPAPSKAGKPSALGDRLAGLVTTRGLQRAGFLFAWKMSSRSRDFRMQVLPSIGYIVVYLVLFVARDLRNVSRLASAELPKGFVITLLYFGAFTLITALTQMRFSEKFKAAWVFTAAPVSSPGQLIVGGFKAMVVKFYLPLALPLLAASTYLIGVEALPNVLLGLSNQLLIAALLTRYNGLQLPFSLPQRTEEKSGRMLRSLMVLMAAGFIAAGHYFLYDFTVAVALCAVLSLAALWLIINSISNQHWTALQQREP